jgi:hypoxanthine-guanine phosphoribosyltransferase
MSFKLINTALKSGGIMKYCEADLVRIAKRENNTKRNYLVVDLLQGKHVPVSPSKALQLFESLAQILKETYKDERILFVGFAETATAIGAQVAISMKGKYIQTTREVIPNVEYLYFSEAHSHATQQKLVKNDMDAVMEETDRIIFVEDEVTTGNTILNIVNLLKKLYPGKTRFSAASLLNGMSEEHLNRYKENDIQLHYLVKTDHRSYEERAERFTGNGTYYPCMQQKAGTMKKLVIPGFCNSRRLVDAADYERACHELWEKVSAAIGTVSNQKILVIGTEECMYPALYVGKKLEEHGNQVWSHSTTRSPIVVSMEEAYPLHSRYELKSVYDAERKTFLYDIKEYDRVFVVTDAPKEETAGRNTLINALRTKNDTITWIRWCENEKFL